MNLGTMLLIVVILALIGVLPVWAARQQLGVRSLGPRRRRAVDSDRPVCNGAPVILGGDDGVWGLNCCLSAQRREATYDL